MQHATSETAELVLAVQNLDGVPSADALAFQVLQLVGSDEVATAVRIAPTGPGYSLIFCAGQLLLPFRSLLMLMIFSSSL